MQPIVFGWSKRGWGSFIFLKTHGPGNSTESVKTNAVLMQSILRLYVRYDFLSVCGFNAIYII